MENAGAALISLWGNLFRVSYISKAEDSGIFGHPVDYSFGWRKIEPPRRMCMGGGTIPNIEERTGPCPPADSSRG